ncbi:hypothetical protein SARI_04051 [Salmonella enterica subsp. arizonae serovar 62:z4,z23:-]|uniref:Uncharacterized protein n=2 Tax=Salmonella enterica subsp. arizonae TaxID=59203 RepID=A9MM65_SALAR|nr:hypothetical protein SARI_04051 [Salmonella enterica subsp. arizonae serovar 62:z4,z23:-]
MLDNRDYGDSTPRESIPQAVHADDAFCQPCPTLLYRGAGFNIA